MSQVDLVILLTEYCNKVLASSLQSERKDTDNIIKTVIATVSDVTKSLVNQINSQEIKTADLSLKIDTVSTYFEKLFFNLKKGLQDTFATVQMDVM